MYTPGDKYKTLIKRIESGQKDEFLDALQRNAERLNCFAVWKAIRNRKQRIQLEKAGVGKKLVLAPKVPEWCIVGAFTPQDVSPIESVGRMLEAFDEGYPGNRDAAAFRGVHIRCNSLEVEAGLQLGEAYTVLSNTVEHYVVFQSVLELSGVQHWKVTLSTEKRLLFTERHVKETSAILKTLEVISDECLI